MAEHRISFRPSELALIIGSLQAVLARCNWQMSAAGMARRDGRDLCVYEYTRDEIMALILKLQKHIEQPQP